MPALGLLKNIFASPAALGDIVKGARDGLDALVYTSEEKAHDNAKLLQQQADIRLRAQEQVVAWMRATAPQAKTRRWLVKLIASIWAAAFTSPILMRIAAIWLPDYADQLRQSAREITEQVGDVNGFMLLIAGYYLGAPHVSGILDTIVSARKGRRKIGEADTAEA